ncbi:MAG: hypothetical protein U0325_04370 [Polyangiales bacterium]
MEGLATANALALGGDLSCALRDGRVFCWGSDRGSLLQAMAGDTSIRKCASWSCRGVAAAVGDLATVRRVSVRGTGEGDTPHLACAVHAAGAVTCWGRRGLLGRGDPLDPNGLSDAPGPVIEGLAAQEVQVGEGFACALTTAGGVACWGAVQGCRAGRPGAEGEVAPRPVPLALSGVRALAVGARHACALVGDAEVWCWGDGAQGQLGHGALAAPAGCAPVRAELAP